MLFGFRRTACFPVDTWIEKVYVENLNGKEKDRKKIAKELTEKFGDNSGYVQQYLFYYKRSLENK
jgi:N-glycosylase/DNA lyase